MVVQLQILNSFLLCCVYLTSGIRTNNLLIWINMHFPSTWLMSQHNSTHNRKESQFLVAFFLFLSIKTYIYYVHYITLKFRIICHLILSTIYQACAYFSYYDYCCCCCVCWLWKYVKTRNILEIYIYIYINIYLKLACKMASLI